MKKKKMIWLGITVTLILLSISGTILFQMYQKAEASAEPRIQTPHSNRFFTLYSKNIEHHITLGAVGDILIHDWVYDDAKTKNGWDFNPMFQHVSSKLAEPDLLLANQETILGGEKIGISSYPMFNSPQQVGDALLANGVDIVSTANNHSLDKWERGLVASLDYMDQIGLQHVGTYRSPEEQQTVKVIGKNGFRIAYLSYSYGTNGMPVPEGKDYLINLINEEKMKDEIHRAKKVADVIVMSIHWGNEYQRFPTDDQKKLAQFLVDEGVDVIFGHHPHVLQPMEWLKGKDGHQALVVYSLGNFLSGQMWDYKDIGGLATIDITKTVDENGVRIQLTNPTFFPTYVSNKRLRQYRIVPLQKAAPYGLKNVAKEYKEIMEHMTKGLQQ